MRLKHQRDIEKIRGILAGVREELDKADTLIKQMLVEEQPKEIFLNEETMQVRKQPKKEQRPVRP